MKNLIICFLLISSYYALGQQSIDLYVDSIVQSHAEVDDTDITEITSLLQEAETILELDLLAAETKTLEALRLSEQYCFIQSQAKAHYLLGEIAIKKMEIDNALTHFGISVKKYLQMGLPSEKVKAEQRIGEICFNASYYSRAISALKEVLTYQKIVADTSEIIKNLIRISICYEEQGEYLLSIDYANEGYELAIKINELADAARCLNNVAFVHRARGNSELALEYFEKAYDLAVITGKTGYQATFTQNMGIIYSRSGEYVKSLQAYMKAHIIFDKHLMSITVPTSYIKIYKEILFDIYKNEESDKLRRATNLKRDIKKYKDQIAKAQDKFVSDDIDKNTYYQMESRYNSLINKLSEDLNELNSQGENFIQYLNSGMTLLEDIKGFYESSPIEIKHKIISVLYPEGLTYDGKKYLNDETNVFVTCIVNKINTLKTMGQKNIDKKADISTMVAPTGLEPVSKV